MVSGDVPLYHSSNAVSKPAASGKPGGGMGHQIYTQLMNGVSHMLPFVVGGGILIAIAFLLDGLLVDMNALSEAERAGFGTITPVAALFKGIGDTAFGFMLPVLFCRRNDGVKRKFRFPWGACGRICCGVSDPGTA